MAEPERKPLLASFPDALFIAGLTALAYWLSFTYEAAYLRVFALPPELVEVSLQTTLLVAFVLYGAGSTIFWLINPLSILWKDRSTQRKLIPLTVTTIVCLWWLLNFGFRTEDLVMYLVFMTFAAFLTVVLFSYQTVIDESLNSSPPTLIDIVRTASGPTGYTFILWAFMGTFLASIAGMAKGATQKEFFLFSDYPEIAVIRIYGDRILALPVDRKSKTVKQRLIIRR